MAHVVLDNLGKRYPNGVLAVDALSLEIADGELVVLLGPSGCGKTTILRLVAGLEQPTAGSIRIGGRAVEHLPPRARDVAMVFQRPALYPYLSVRENLAFGLRLRGQLGPSDLRERVAATARLLDLEPALDRLPQQLSGGEQQRVALGRALVREPAVFLLDEPLTHLDERRREEMRRELHLLSQRLRTTMIYVTHDQAEAMMLADRLVVLERGRVQQVGPPQAVYERPSNRFVAGFLGSPPMNLVAGRLACRDGGLCFATADWDIPLPPDLGVRAVGDVVLGLRPEDLRLGVGGVAMTVVLREALGRESVLTLERGATRWLVRVPGRADVEAGASVEVVMDLERSHWFDPASGRALPQGRPAG